MYVDDTLLAENNIKMIQATKKWLSSVFKIKDMGQYRYVQGVDISKNRCKKLLGLSQEAYINKIIKHFQTHYSKPMDPPVGKALTLILHQCPKTNKEKERMSNGLYASAIGSLMYAICFAVGSVSPYQNNS